MVRVPAVVALAVLAASLLACSAPAAAPTPTPSLPRPTPTPAATPVPTLDAATFDVQDAFMTNVNDLTSEVETLATAQCADLTAETQANPTEVTEIRGFAAALQRVGGQQQALSTSDDVKSSLSDLSKAMAQLDNALTTCGIKAP
jgi:hypothetical protein